MKDRSSSKRKSREKHIMNRLFTGILLLGSAILLMTSCKSTRPLIKAPLKEEGPEYLYTRLKDNELRFDWLSAKFDASYSGKKNSSSFKDPDAEAGKRHPDVGPDQPEAGGAP